MACRTWTTSTFGETLCPLGLHFNKLPHTTSAIAGKTQIMVVVDRLTKMAHLIGLHTNASAKDVADTFHREVRKLHGLPAEIILDMDARFSREFWNYCARCESNDACQWLTTLKLTDKPKERTKCWEVTYQPLSTTIRTPCTNYCH